MKKWVNELMPIILDMLQDSSSLPKREVIHICLLQYFEMFSNTDGVEILKVALWSLGQLVESTGYVVEPYRKYPHLLEVLLNFLKTEQSPGIRREVY